MADGVVDQDIISTLVTHLCTGTSQKKQQIGFGMRYAERLKCGEKNRVAKRYSELSRHLHILIQNLADRLLKHNGEPIGFFHLLYIEAEHRLVNIPLKDIQTADG